METRGPKSKKAKCLAGLVCVLFVATVILSTMAPVMGWAGATTPESYLQQQVQWLSTSSPPYNTHTLTFTMCTNSGLTYVVSYATGGLTYNASTGNLEGGASQYFSDRLWTNIITSPGKLPPSPTLPFDPTRTDQIKIDLNVKTGNATITLLSWGNAVVAFPLQYQNQLLYGIQNTGDQNWQSIIISIQQVLTGGPK
jgi:hypothetical protein